METLAKYCTACWRHCKLYDLAVITSNTVKDNNVINATLTLTCPYPNDSRTTASDTDND